MSRIINLSDPPLPNGVLIGGVANIVYTPTIEVPSPQTRPTSNGAVVGGLPLVVGDKWFNPSTGVEGFWNGALWLEATLRNGGGQYNSVSTSSIFPSVNGSLANVPCGFSIFVERGVTRYSCATADSSNYWEMAGSFRFFDSGITTQALYLLVTANANTATPITVVTPINQSLIQPFIYFCGSTASKFGAPANLSAVVTIQYRLIL